MVRCKALNAIFAIVPLIAVAGCAPAKKAYTVAMTGDAGTGYQGSCLVTNGTSSETKEISGSVGAMGGVLDKIPFDGTAISCTAQKQGSSGKLEMTIMADYTNYIGNSTTTDPHGVVSVAGK